MPTLPTLEAALRAKGESQRKTLIRYLDYAFGRYIKKRDKYTCVITGAKRLLTVSHLFGREACPNLRWDERNAFTMSEEQHRLYHEGDPFPFIDWYVATYGEAQLAELKALAHKRPKDYSIMELIDLVNKYVRKHRELPDVKASNGRYL